MVARRRRTAAQRSPWYVAVIGAAVLALAACSQSAPPSSSTGGTLAPTLPAPLSTPTPTGSEAAALAGIYANTAAGMLTDVTKAAKPLVYVPNSANGNVSVIDPATLAVVATLPAGLTPQHVVPSWDLRTLWVLDEAGGAVFPIDPATATIGAPIAVPDPTDLYFAPAGDEALVLSSGKRRIDVRDPHTMALIRQLPVACKGLGGLDFSSDGSFFLVACSYSGQLFVVPTDGSGIRSTIDLNPITTPGATDPRVARSGGATLQLTASSQPEDVRLSPDGTTFLVSDSVRNGVWLIDAATQTERAFVYTGRGAAAVIPSRNAQQFFVANRGEGTVSVLDSHTLTVTDKWVIPGAGSPDSGGVSADGTQLWLSGRNNSTVYVLSTVDGHQITQIPVGGGPRGLAVWPQPGRFSLGNTGNMR